MSEIKYTPEPWGYIDHGVDEICVYGNDQDGDGGDSPCVAVLDGEGDWDWQSMDQRIADARRIVACVNACKGHTTEELENHPAPIVTKLLNARDAVEQQRDHLQEALYVALPYVENAELDDGYKKGTVTRSIRFIRDAINKAEESK